MIVGVPAGAVSVQARRIGYEARVVDVVMTAEKRDVGRDHAQAGSRGARAAGRQGRRGRSAARILRPQGPAFEQLREIFRSEGHSKKARRDLPERSLSRHARGDSSRQPDRRGTPSRFAAASQCFGSTVSAFQTPRSTMSSLRATSRASKFYISMAGTPAPYLDRSTACLRHNPRLDEESIEPMSRYRL